jgi:hypothetical protein
VAANEILLQVKGEEPLNAPAALFGNFLSIARVGTDVQFEFVFVDLNVLAQMIQGAPTTASPTVGAPVTGQTVAKVIMPAASFVQLKAHLAQIFSDIEKEMAKVQEAQNASTSERRATGL